MGLAVGVALGVGVAVAVDDALGVGDPLAVPLALEPTVALDVGVGTLLGVADGVADCDEESVSPPLAVVLAAPLKDCAGLAAAALGVGCKGDTEADPEGLTLAATDGAAPTLAHAVAPPVGDEYPVPTSVTMADPENARGDPLALKDTDAGGLLPGALNEACEVADTDATGEALAAAAALYKELADASPVPSNETAGEDDAALGEPLALTGDSDWVALLAAALDDGCDSDDEDAAADALTSALVVAYPVPMSVTTAVAESGLGVLQPETDCDWGTLVAMAVAESLGATLAESDSAAVTLALDESTEDAVARPVPTSVDATDGDCSALSDHTPPLEEGEGDELLATDAAIDALTGIDGSELALTTWEAPALGDA